MSTFQVKAYITFDIPCDDFEDEDPRYGQAEDVLIEELEKIADTYGWDLSDLEIK